MAILLLIVAATTLACGNPQEQVTSDETSAASPSSEPTTQTPITMPTVIAGLTDTGYTAPDGRALYRECISPGLPLPPDLPEPSETQIAEPTVDPAIDPNAGRTPPTQDELPLFDPITLAPADATDWAARTSACYDYALQIPPNWTLGPFRNAGYQQGENATLVSNNGRDKIEIGVFYTPVDYLALNQGVSLGESEYLLLGPVSIVQDGAPGRMTYLEVDGELDGVYVSYLFSPRQDWYISIGLWLTQPYDAASAADSRAVVQSLTFP